MRLYEGTNFRCFAPDQCCLFCKKCSDIFIVSDLFKTEPGSWSGTPKANYDFQGPYMFICIDGHSGDWETCGAFQEKEDE